MNECYERNQRRPSRHQPGAEHAMASRPVYLRDDYRGSTELAGKVALITGGDSSIGRAVAIHYVKEGAGVAIVYKDETEDALETARLIDDLGGNCLLLCGDVADEEFCRRCVSETMTRFRRLDILVNNAAGQQTRETREHISGEELRQTFATHVFAYFYMTQAALPYLGKGSCIINTTSVTTCGSHHLIDYASTKGAIVAFTRSLSDKLLRERGIRVNGVAPGPVWTPLMPAASFEAGHAAEFGPDTPMGQAGQPSEAVQCYVFLASADAAYMNGQILHPTRDAVHVLGGRPRQLRF